MRKKAATISVVLAGLIGGLAVLIWNSGSLSSIGVDEVSPAQVAQTSESSISEVDASDRQSPRSTGREGSLSEELVNALALAEAGDAVAAKRAAEILQYCWVINVDQEAWRRHMAEQAKRVPGNAAMIEDAFNRKMVRCEGVMGGNPYDASIVADLLAKAASSGDAGALMNLALRTGDVASEDAPVLIDSVIQSGDLNEIRDAGVLIGFIGSESTEQFRPLANSELGVHAWQVAACRMGANCGPGSLVMDGICMSMGRCGGDYESFVRSQWVPQGRIADFERLVTHAESIIGEE